MLIKKNDDYLCSFGTFYNTVYSVIVMWVPWIMWIILYILHVPLLIIEIIKC